MRPAPAAAHAVSAVQGLLERHTFADGVETRHDYEVPIFLRIRCSFDAIHHCLLVGHRCAFTVHVCFDADTVLNHDDRSASPRTDMRKLSTLMP